ncbi:MAG: cytochrome P460 family protein [Candidatus Acidiferrum sp.]
MRIFLLLPLAALFIAIPLAPVGSTPGSSAMPWPQYDSTGALLQPKNFEHWTFVGSNIGMSYDTDHPQGPGEFHNIYTQPEAFDAYKATGKFPVNTMFLLVVYQPAQKVSINKAGYFEGEYTGLAVSVKDPSRFKDGWAYFSFGESGNLAETVKAMPSPMCFACHDQHADDDHVFVQFHPILRAARHKTLP